MLRNITAVYPSQYILSHTNTVITYTDAKQTSPQRQIHTYVSPILQAFYPMYYAVLHQWLEKHAGHLGIPAVCPSSHPVPDTLTESMLLDIDIFFHNVKFFL